MTQPWYDRMVQALRFGRRLELFLFVGPGVLARPALAQLAERLVEFGPPRWHQLQRDGFGALIDEPDPEHLHLVHGFERMPVELARELAGRLNLNRDGLQILAAPILFWIPEDFYEDFQRYAPDLLAWRSQVVVVTRHDFAIDLDTIAEENLQIRRELIAGSP